MVGIKTTMSRIGATLATISSCAKRTAVRSLVVFAALAITTNSNAYEIPTTPSGTWTASGISVGTIPGSPAASPAETGTYFKTTPSGLRVTITSNGVFPNGSSGAYFSSPANTSTTGLTPSAAGTNPGVFTTTPVLPSTTNPLNMLVSVDQCRLTATALTTCSGLGNYTIVFTDPLGGLVPVVAPKIHITRIGGTVGAMELGSGLQINAAGSTPGIGFAATAAKTVTFTTTGGNEVFGDPNAAGTNLNVNCGATATSSAGCGTEQVTGNPSTIMLNVKAYRTAVAPNIWDKGGDAFFFDTSFDEDFGGAPNTYEGGGVAAAHLLTDLRLGAGVTAENTAVAADANGGADASGLLTVSPLAVAAGAAPGDTNDGVASFPALTTDLIGGSYTVTPTFSGASRGGKICGWIDFNQDGLYTAAEGICNTFAAAATSAPLTWTLPTALAAGQTYARVRITYDTNMTTASFNGLFSSGEVEDYQLNIMPSVRVVKALSPVADTGTFNLTINGTTFASAIGNGGTTNFRSVYHTGTPDVTVATNIKTAAVTGVVLTETAAGATVLTNYTTTSACVNAAGTAVTVGGTALAPSITIPQSVTGASANGQAQTITCTLTNTRKPTVTLTKISNGAVGGFTFTGTNGWTSQTITTVTSGTGVTGAAQTLTAAATATTITESIPVGYVLASISCTGLGTGGTATPNLGTGAVALDAAATAAGSNIACTFTNTKLPTVTLTKVSNGGVGGFTFNGTNGWTSQTITTVTSGTGVAGPTQTLTAAATSTTITESIPAGYILASATCTGLGTGGTATPNLATGALVLDAAATAAGSNIACTFTNTKLPTVTLTKVSNGGVGGFTFNGTNGWNNQTITTVTAGTGVAGPTQTLTAAATSTTITESIPAGYALTSATCTGMGTGGTATPNLATGALVLDAAATAAGSAIACTFTNAKLPTVTLTKVSNGGVGGFTFTGTNGWTSQTITTVTSGTGVAGAAQTLTAAATSTTITEAIPAGYALASATCTGMGTGGTATPNLATGALVLDAAATAAGSNIACTFTNTKLPTVTLTKVSNGGVGGFTFTGTNGWTSQTITTATSGTGVAGAAQTLTAAATATTITESIPAGYLLTSATCTGLGTGGTAMPNLATGALVLDAAATAAGSNIACTFTNTKRPTVTLTKTSNGAVGGFTFTGTNGWTSQTITTVTSGTGVAGATQTLTAVATSTTITEAIPAGYVLASASCTGMGTGGTATPNLATGALVLDAAATAAGSNIACTFTNTKLPTVTLTKVSNGGVGGFTFTGTNGWTSQTITTVTSGTGVTGATQTLTAAAASTTITETIPGGYVLTAISCSGLGTGGTATPNLSTGAVVLDAAATAAGSNISCTYTNGVPNYTVAKVVDSATVSTPVLLTYTISVKNTGAAPLTSITTSDVLTQGGNARSLTSGPTLASGDTNSNGILETTETWVYTATHLITQAEIDDGTTFSNVMTVGTAQMASKTSNAATTTITQTPNVQVTKTSNKAGPLVVGDVITYSFLVQNTGNVTLTGISVAETAFNGTGGTGAITPAGGAATLAPGATTTFTATYTVTQTDVDTL